ncbi:MAG: hypothetical protein OEZ10_10575 [Gammaproteobacteria bacterium]|nr:hypothetical protein [Gammaproteobacteria bacterium]
MTAQKNNQHMQQATAVLLICISILMLVLILSTQNVLAAQALPEPGTCTDPRPQVCTMDYNPVCADRDTGIRCIKAPCPATEKKTYSNACHACADAKVRSFRPGACDSPGPVAR